MDEIQAQSACGSKYTQTGGSSAAEYGDPHFHMGVDFLIVPSNIVRKDPRFMQLNVQ